MESDQELLSQHKPPMILTVKELLVMSDIMLMVFQLELTSMEILLLLVIAPLLEIIQSE